MRAAAIALGMLLAAGVGYELGHIVGFRAGSSFELRWCAATTKE